MFGPRGFTNHDDDGDNDDDSDDDDNQVFYNIDIAALKISPGFTGFDDDRCGCGFDDLPSVYNRDDFDLEDKVVLKNGAASGTTCGRIIKCPYLFQLSALTGSKWHH